MAEQNPNPEPWTNDKSDGCTGVPDWWPGIGNMWLCCMKHDKAYYYGGDEKAKLLADRRFKFCIERKGCVVCKMVAWVRYKGVRWLGAPAFNWAGPGLPEDD